MDYMGIVTIIGAVIAFLIAYFDNGEKKYEKLKEQYFDNLLNIFYKSYTKNNNINTIRFIKKNFDEKDTYIPKYIYYLVENDEKEKLKKVLLLDYSNYYPNFTNSLRGSINKLFSKIYSIFLIICSFFSVWGIFAIIVFFIRFLKTVNYEFQGSHMSTNFIILQLISPSLGSIMFPSWVVDFINILIMLILTYMPVYIVNMYLKKNDEYTLNLKRIKKIVDKKSNTYDKKSNKYYI